MPVKNTVGAVRDIEELYKYLCKNDSPEKALKVLSKIEMAIDSLATSPRRGAFPRELLDLGIREFREIYFKPYRIIYQAKAEAVYIRLVSDGRRDMRELLQQRLLGA